METLKAQLLRIQQQLSGLSASQKMLTVSLVTIMVMTLVWLSRYAGTAEYEPVLDQSLSAQDVGQIKAALDAHNIPANVVGDRVMVPADRKLEAFAMLAYNNALPSNISGAWDEMSKQMSPWDSTSKTDTLRNHMKEQMLSDVIAGFFPGVSKANVIINPVSERRVGASLVPTAAVQIATRGDDLNVKRLVDAAASTVASAVSGLSKSQVSVVINGIPHQVQDNSDGFSSGDLQDQIDALEKSTCEKIAGILMPSALVAVKCDIDNTSSLQTVQGYDKAKSLIVEKKIETSSEENSQPASGGPEPGAVPNTGLSIAQAAPAAGPTNTSEKNDTEMQIYPGMTTEQINKPAGRATVISAAVRLPRSYLIAKYKSAIPDGKEPDDTMLTTLAAAEFAQIRKDVQNATGVKSDDSISVDTYWDTGAPLLLASGNESATSTSNVASMLTGHVKEIAVGALALMSLFMVSSIVKKNSPAPPVPMPVMEQETPHLVGEERVAGIATHGDAMLDGMEMDEDAVKAHQMVEQVSTMVKEDPDAAASLVKRWLNR
jgi:flagellar biosynthesis/type III secretory pathway M-ring protein FliF/YscJ